MNLTTYTLSMTRNRNRKRKARRVIKIYKNYNIRKEVIIMEKEEKKINWLKLLIEIAKVVISFLAGTQI